MNPFLYVISSVVDLTVTIDENGIPLKCISLSYGMFANAYGDICVYDVIDAGNVNDVKLVPLNILFPMQLVNASYDGSSNTTDVKLVHP